MGELDLECSFQKTPKVIFKLFTEFIVIYLQVCAKVLVIAVKGKTC